ncbi:MAG: hypothetical protein QXY62_00560 [Candidatus Altiarchaeota archaeon]
MKDIVSGARLITCGKFFWNKSIGFGNRKTKRKADKNAREKFSKGPEIAITSSFSGFSGISTFARPPIGNKIILWTGMPFFIATNECNNSCKKTIVNIIKKIKIVAIPERNPASRKDIVNKNIKNKIKVMCNSTEIPKIWKILYEDFILFN